MTKTIIVNESPSRHEAATNPDGSHKYVSNGGYYVPMYNEFGRKLTEEEKQRELDFMVDRIKPDNIVSEYNHLGKRLPVDKKAEADRLNKFISRAQRMRDLEIKPENWFIKAVNKFKNWIKI